MKTRRKALGRAGIWAGTVILFFAIWEGLVWFGPLARLAAAPSAVLRWSVQHADRLWFHLPVTLWETLAGFAIACSVALLCGMLIEAIPSWRHGAVTLLAALNSIPKVVFAPLLFVWLGYDLAPKIAMGALIAFFPILIGFLHGLEQVDRSMDVFLATTGASRAHIFFGVRFPWALRSTVAGCKIGIGLALVGALVSEFINASRGLGYLVKTGEDNFDLEMQFAGIVAASLLGLVLYLAIEFVDLKLLLRFPPLRSESNGAAK